MRIKLKSNINIKDINETELALRKITIISGSEIGETGIIQLVHSDSKMASIIFDRDGQMHGKFNLDSLRLKSITIEEFDEDIVEIQEEINMLQNKKIYLSENEIEVFDELKFEAHELTKKILGMEDPKDAENAVFELIKSKQK